MVKKAGRTRSQSQSVSKKNPLAAGDKDVKIPGLGGGGGGDILGHKGRYIKQVDNNVLYGAGALLLLGGGYYAFSQGWFNNLPFVSTLFTPAVPTNVMVTPNQVPQGTTATMTGSFNPTGVNTYYAVFNSIGTSVLNGSLGTNVSSFNTSLATSSLPTGTYTVVVSDQPITGPPAGAIIGQPASPVLGINQQLQDNFAPTSTTLQTVAGTQSTGQSGPSNISLT